MKALLLNQFTWGSFITTAFTLLILYLVLQFVHRVLRTTNFLGRFQINIQHFIHYLLLIYEPTVLLILGSVFVLVNPIFHGLLAFLLFLGGFSHLRNYINGRIAQFDAALTIGRRLSTEGLYGIIDKMGRLGLRLKTSQGLHYISYSRLLKNGYMLISGEEVGGFYRLKITPCEPSDKVNYALQLRDLFTTVPYLDWNHKPELFPSDETPHQLNVRIVVKEKRHLHELIALIQEWGFVCKISKK